LKCGADPVVIYVLALLLAMLGGCSNGNNNSLSADDFGSLPDNSTLLPGGAAPPATEDPNTQPAPTVGTPPGPSTGNQIQTTNAALLAGSSLDIITKLITAADITTVMVLDGVSLITNPNTQAGLTVPLSQCQNNNSTGPENRITFNFFSPGFILPEGMNLNGNFVQCAIENALVSGFIDLSGISVTGVPGAPSGDWRVTGTLSFGSLDFLNDDGTKTIFSNDLNYTANMSNGVLTITLGVETLNAEHNLNNRVHINYLLEPFLIRTVENTNTLQYTITITANPSFGQSLINRYTTNFVPDDQGVMSWLPVGDDIELLASADIIPILWQGGGKPNIFTDPPDGGEFLLEEPTGNSSINMVLDSAGITLLIDSGASINTQTTTWENLLAQ